MKHTVVGKIVAVPISKLKPQNDLNTELFPIENGDNLKTMANSISSVGLDRPIEITENYAVVCGMNRLAAAKAAGHKTINCVFKKFESKEDMIDFMMRENVIRRHFTRQVRRNVIANYARITKKKLTAKEVAEKFGISLPTAYQSLKDVTFQPNKKRKKSDREKLLQLIDKRFSRTLNEAKLCPSVVVTEIRKKAESNLEALKQREREAKKEERK
jgi:ParB-like chromosome segregation protein Spo0J